MLGRQLVVEDDHADFRLRVVLAGGDVVTDFLQFAFADVGDGVGHVELLREAFGHFRACGLGEEGQFVQVFVCLAFVLQPCDEADEYGLFGLRL